MLLYWFLAGPQSKPSPHTIAQRSTRSLCPASLTGFQHSWRVWGAAGYLPAPCHCVCVPKPHPCTTQALWPVEVPRDASWSWHCPPGGTGSTCVWKHHPGALVGPSASSCVCGCKSSVRQENVTVFGCLTHEVPLSLGDAAVTCSKESLAGFLLSVSATTRVARLRIPFPQTGTWFLALRSLCGVGPRFVRCRNATAEVRMRTFLSPCVDDCGPYGQCKLLRTHNYLYAACECKAGWRGWGCTDSADALTYGFQLLSTLLLCLSNLMFLPPVVLAIRSRYVLEAAVYTFTMFFSTFYHACDQPGIVVFCIMDYDVLQFCDFLGSLMSVWVTVIAMARLQPVVKQVLYLLGAMLLSMALQLDRHGLWNLLGPSLFALGILATAWTVRSVRRRHCYPPTWRRWLFYLCPGSLIAGSAVLLYAFVETRDNYFYIHSIWHMLIAGSVGFLLPPRAKTDHRVPSGARARGCGYQLCINEQEELGLVGPGGATVSSICAS
uniref:Transmembrane protein 8B n=1 Tax=Piliocolobus tephrosceles TaxID=591936 RepID=A0A8C9LQM0_9PRIM